MPISQVAQTHSSVANANKSFEQSDKIQGCSELSQFTLDIKKHHNKNDSDSDDNVENIVCIAYVIPHDLKYVDHDQLLSLDVSISESEDIPSQQNLLIDRSKPDIQNAENILAISNTSDNFEKQGGMSSVNNEQAIDQIKNIAQIKNIVVDQNTVSNIRNSIQTDDQFVAQNASESFHESLLSSVDEQSLFKNKSSSPVVSEQSLFKTNKSLTTEQPIYHQTTDIYVQTNYNNFDLSVQNKSLDPTYHKILDNIDNYFANQNIYETSDIASLNDKYRILSHVKGEYTQVVIEHDNVSINVVFNKDNEIKLNFIANSAELIHAISEHKNDMYQRMSNEGYFISDFQCDCQPEYRGNHHSNKNNGIQYEQLEQFNTKTQIILTEKHDNSYVVDMWV